MRPWFVLGAAFTVIALTAGCSKERKWESVCQVIAHRVIETSNDGTPELVDLELEWDPCPGDQFQVVRGGKEFAECTAKYELGTYVPVRVAQRWNNLGFYEWDIFQVGDCAREIEWDSEGSYEKSQECSEVRQYGRVIGFDCLRRPKKNLVSVCPWMARY